MMNSRITPLASLVIGVCVALSPETVALGNESNEKQEEQDSIFQNILGVFKNKPDLLPMRGKITPTRDLQPTTPPLPEIGQFIDMPGTNGTVEFTRVTQRTDDNRHQHSYSRRAAIDPHNKYILLNGSLLDLKTFETVETPPFGFEYVASQIEKDTFYGWVENKLVKWNAATGKTTDIWTATDCCFTIGKYEGSISLDDNFLPITWGKETNLGIIDLQKGMLIGTISSNDVDGKFNWLDVSPLGTYAVVGTDTGVFRYDIDFTNVVALNTKLSGNAHADLALDLNNNEVIVQEGNYHDGDISYTLLEENKTYFLDVVDTVKTDVEYPNSAAHISAQAHGVPGKVLVSLQHRSGQSSIFSIDLEPEQNKIANWGHTFTTGHSYFTEAKATISNDATMVLWTSNWMQGDQTYEFLARIKH